MGWLFCLAWRALFSLTGAPALRPALRGGARQARASAPYNFWRLRLRFFDTSTAQLWEKDPDDQSGRAERRGGAYAPRPRRPERSEEQP